MNPGLPSLNQAREERKRTLVSGKFRLRAMAPQFWLWTLLGMAAFGVIYWRIASGQLESQKSVVMARQRAVHRSLGPRILPFAERVERLTLGLAATPQAQFLSPELVLSELQRRPGVYLRLRLDQAKDAASIRRAASTSLNDGFTSCFFIREAQPDPTKGPACSTSSNCQAGLVCNEWDVCSVPPRPYNLRLAYRALKVLLPEFTDTLHEATNDLEVRAQERELEQVTRVDVPVAIEVLQRAKLFTVVLDEPEPAVEQREDAERRKAGIYDSPDQRVQRLAHWARVGVWDLATGRPLVRWRGRAEGRLLQAGRRVTLSADVEASRARQANSCALAVEVKEAVSLLEERRHAAEKAAAANPN